MRRDASAIGAVLGMIVLVGILALEVVLPTVVTGQQRLTATTDGDVITAYYDHDQLTWLLAPAMLLPVLFAGFAVALRDTLRGVPGADWLAGTGLALAIVEASLLLVHVALQGALVTAATQRLEVAPVFRLYDLTYNGSIYAVEAGIVLAFGLAVRGHTAFPRWLPAAAVVVAALQLANLTAVFGALPPALTIAGNLGFAAWLAASSYGLFRVTRVTPERTASEGAIA